MELRQRKLNSGLQIGHVVATRYVCAQMKKYKN